MRRVTMVLMVLATLAQAGPAAAKKKRKNVAPPPETPTAVSPVASDGTPPKDEAPSSGSGAASSLGGLEVSARGMYVDGWTAGGQIGFALEPRIVIGVHLDYNVSHQHEVLRYWCVDSDAAQCVRGPTLLGAFFRLHPFGASVVDPYVELGLAHAWRHHQWPDRPMVTDLAIPVFVGADVRLGPISIAPFGGVVWMPTYEGATGGHKGPTRIFNPAAGLRLTLRL